MFERAPKARALSDAGLRRFGLGLIALSAILRIAAYPIRTSDYTYFVSKWFDALASHPGLTAFLQPFSDYTPLYLYLLKALTFIPLPSLYTSKTLSVLFDIAIAATAAALWAGTQENRGRGRILFVFGVVFAIPTVIVNGSLWGQSDAIYAAGTLFSFYALLTDRPMLAAAAFGLALSMKVQTLFFAPVFLGLLLKRYDWWLLFIVPAVYLALLIPAWMGGASPGDLLLIPFHQAKEYQWLSVSAQSIFAFVTFSDIALSPGVQSMLFWFGFLIAALCAFIAARLAYRVFGKTSTEKIIEIALWCTLALPFFLPRMHERYFFLADIFSVLLVLWEPRAWYFPALVVSSSLFSYLPYLSQQVGWLSGIHVDLRLTALTTGAALVLLSIRLWRRYRPEGGWKGLRPGTLTRVTRLNRAEPTRRGDDRTCCDPA